MQLFGLVGLLITFMLVGWWFWGAGPQAEVPTEEETILYKEALDQAESVAGSGMRPAGSGVEKVEIYSKISFPKDTKNVDLSGKGLNGSLKAEIRHLSDLEELDLSDNRFTALPAEIGQLSKLKYLDVSNNPITGLPYELGNLQSLRQLDLRGTDYSWRDLEEIKKTLPPTTVVLID